MKVYIELLFLDNLVLNFIILYFSGLFARIPLRFARELAGAAAGGIYACFMFAFQGILASIAARILVSFLMCFIAFYKKKTIKACCKTVLYFYINTLVMGGAAFAFLNLSSQKYFIQGGVIIGGTVIRYVLCGVLAAILLIALFKRVYRVQFHKQLMYDIVVEFLGKQISCRAYLDTGNTLKEPLSGLPVIIIEKKIIQELLPDHMKTFLEDGKIAEAANEDWMKKLRVLPCKGIIDKKGALFGFKPDAIRLINKNDEKNLMAVLAVTNDILNDTGMYHALLGPEVLV